MNVYTTYLQRTLIYIYIYNIFTEINLTNKGKKHHAINKLNNTFKFIQTHVSKFRSYSNRKSGVIHQLFYWDDLNKQANEQTNKQTHKQETKQKKQKTKQNKTKQKTKKTKKTKKKTTKIPLSKGNIMFMKVLCWCNYYF